MPERKSRHEFRELHGQRFVIGELYLFHPVKKYCPSRGSLWGIYDKTEEGIIYLESSTPDLQHFFTWQRLPDGYRCSRRATRSELRDYIFNFACYEWRHTGHRPDSLCCP